MKAQFQISTGQFEYIMIEDDVLTVSDAVERYHSLKKAYTFNEPPTSVGLDPKEWNLALDGYLTVGNMPSDVYERMNDEQKRVCQEIKKAFARLKPKETRE